MHDPSIEDRQREPTYVNIIDKELIDFVKSNPFHILSLSAINFLTSEICSLAVREQPHIIFHLPKDRRSVDLYKTALLKCPNIIVNVPDDMIEELSDVLTDEFYKSSIDSDKLTINNLPDKPEWLLEYYISKKPNEIINMPPNKINYDICYIAVSRKGTLLQFIPKKFIDEELCIAAVRNDDRVLNYVPEEFRTSKRVRKAAFYDFIYDMESSRKKTEPYDSENFSFLN